MSDWSKLVGRRLLVREIRGSIVEPRHTVEVVVRELAPSGKWVRFRWTSDELSWVGADEYEVVEELPSEVPVDATTLRAGAEMIAREIWFRTTSGQMFRMPPSDSEEKVVEYAMLLWDRDAFGTLLGHDANRVPFNDVVNGSGSHHRIEFEQAVRAWLVIHFKP